MADWQSKKDAAKALHCSSRTIESFCSQGVLIAGKHFYRAGLRSGSLIFDVDKCREALLKHTAEREKGQSETYDEEYLDQLIQEARANG